jgi:chromosome segregation ATPase
VSRRRQRRFDPRREPEEEKPGERNHIDRVFRPTSQTASPLANATSVSEPRLAAPVASRPTSSDTREDDVALRRELSQLERQLADAQRELANKDEELASQLEKQLLAAAEVTAMHEQLRSERARAEQLTAQLAAASGLEQRVEESLSNAHDLADTLAREREKRDLLDRRVSELIGQVAGDRARWTDQRARLETQHTVQLDALEGARRVALETALAAHDGDLMRIEEHHRAELARQRAHYERELAALRGELAPNVVEARSLDAERERVASELAALRAEAAKAVAERDEQHKGELVQIAVSHNDDLTAQARELAAELARVSAERDAATAAAAEVARAARQQEQQWESTAAQLRQQLKELQTQLGEAKETRGWLEADKATADERLTAAAREVLALSDEGRALRDRIEAAEAEVRRSAQDRARYIAYLEEGLAMLGALPPKG